MNFSKNFLKCCSLCYSGVALSKRHVSLSAARRFMCRNQPKQTKRPILRYKSLVCYSTNVTDTEEITVVSYIDTQPLTEIEKAKKDLFNNSTDGKISKIQRCASIEEVFNFYRDNADSLNYQHLTQIVLALCDLQNIFIYNYEERDDAKPIQLFYNELSKHKEFKSLTNSIEKSLSSFDTLFLSYVIVYLSKLGASDEESPLIQNMAIELKNRLLDNFSLDIAARLLKVVFLEESVRPYYIVMDLIPKIYETIEHIETPRELEDLTACLFKLHNIVPKGVLETYNTKINELIDDEKLTRADRHVVLKVLSIFHNPRIRNRYVSTTCKCISLLKDDIHMFNTSEILYLYEVFFKLQEPGHILNTMQRSAAKRIQEMDDREMDYKNKLILFSSLIYYSSPINKEQFRRKIEQYADKVNTLESLIVLRKVYSYLKICDMRLCQMLWNRICNILEEENDIDKWTALVENYLYFCYDFRGYRHYAFEYLMMTKSKRELETGILTIYPKKFFEVFSLALISSYNTDFINTLLASFYKMSSQLMPVDIFRISQSLQIIHHHSRRTVASQADINKIKCILHEATSKIYSYQNLGPTITCLLIKGAIIRNSHDNDLINDMLESLKKIDYMSSKIIEHLCFVFRGTQTLIPEVVNSCTQYIIENNDRLVTFNVAKVLNLLYTFNYLPVNDDQFFNVAINVLLRDMERLGGLTLLKAALSLCFFQKAPESIVRQIFNVGFLNRLDFELANCYSKDVYPQWVRHALMQLNRAVCLEYPEYKVPWFHEKYVADQQKNYELEEADFPFQTSVREYLDHVCGQDTILDNQFTPYGYTINFVLHMDNKGAPTTSFEAKDTKKIALLLLKDRQYTKFYVRLKGEDALKCRHLEVLGYKVKCIKNSEWSNLLYSQERIDYLKDILFS